jgi:hypothetical protein
LPRSRLACSPIHWGTFRSAARDLRFRSPQPFRVIFSRNRSRRATAATAALDVSAPRKPRPTAAGFYRRRDHHERHLDRPRPCFGKS